MANIIKKIQKAYQQGNLLPILNSYTTPFLQGLKYIMHDPASKLITLHCPDYIEPIKDNDEMEIVEIVGPGKQRIIDTGLSVAVPEGYELQVRPRSGLSFKHKITVTNSPGTINSDYRGEIKIIIFNLGEEDFVINKGDRIAQGVVNKIEQFDIQEVDDLDETERGGGGFGSTGV